MRGTVTRRDFLKFSGTAFAVIAIMPSAVLASEPGIPVLMYHDIGNRTDEYYTVSPALFASQMEWLYSNGFRAILPSEAGALNEAEAGRSVIITFDDGLASFMEFAFPLLREYDFKAVMNIVAAYMGTAMENGWGKPLLSWDECRHLDASGLVEFGCHTYDLHAFTRSAASVSIGDLKKDLKKFREVYRKELGKDPEILAWPYDLHNDRAIEAAKQAGFKYIFTSKPGRLSASGPYDAISRMNVNNEYDMAALRRLMKGM